MKITIADCDKKYYKLLKDKGYYGVDIPFESYLKRDEILTDEYTDKMMDKYKAVCDAGLCVSQMHLSYFPSHGKPIGSGTYEEYEEYMLPMLVKEIELASRMGCPRAVLHPYFSDTLEKSRLGNLSLLAKLLPHLESNNVILCIENIYGPSYGEAFVSTAEELKFYPDHFNSPYIGICLDTGHAIIRGQNPCEMLRILGSTVKAVHLHATIPGADLHTVPYSIGYYDRVNWEELYSLLVENDFRGTFNLEIRRNAQMGDEAIDSYFTYAFNTARGIINQINTASIK